MENLFMNAVKLRTIKISPEVILVHSQGGGDKKRDHSQGQPAHLFGGHRTWGDSEHCSSEGREVSTPSCSV